MLKAYVGVASKQGLSVFQPERDDSLLFIRRCLRQDTRRVAFWVVVHDTDARSVQTLFAHGHRKEALVALDRSAKEIGRISAN